MMGAAALVLGGATFTGCSNDKELFNPEQASLDVVLKYEQAFYKTFGQPAANHTWGFGAATRATRASNEQGNMWCKNYSNVPDPLTPDQIKRVRMYFQQHTFDNPTTVNFNTYFVQQVYKGGSEPGSLSPEKWHAAHPQSDKWLTGSENMDYLTVGTGHEHVSNFNNGDASTNNDVKDGRTYNSWQTPWTEETAAAAGKSWADAQNENFNMLASHPDKIMLVENVPTTCFGYWQSNGSQGWDDKYVCIDGSVIDAWAADQTGVDTGEAVTGRYFVGLDFEQIADVNYYESGVQKFFTYNGTDYPYMSQNNDKYAGEYMSKTDSELYNNGNNASDGYKEAVGTWLADGWRPIGGRNLREWVKVAHAADHVYSDWIVAITPGITWDENEPKPSLRVMAEDLSATESSDFDFNDVVFDVEYVDATHVTLTLQAAGGTLPLKIFKAQNATETLTQEFMNTAEAYEVHDLFKVATNVMVNTGITSKPAVGNLTITGQFSNNQDQFAQDVKNIRIAVLKKVNGGEEQWFEMKAEQGKAACKFAIPTNIHWASERTNVNSAFNFDEWVVNPNTPLMPAE